MQMLGNFGAKRNFTFYIFCLPVQKTFPRHCLFLRPVSLELGVQLAAATPRKKLGQN